MITIASIWIETMQVGLGIDFQPIYGELMLTLTGPNGVVLVTFETKDVASLELVPGDYLVAVSGINGATNDYKLVLIIDNHGDTPDTATPVAIGDTIEEFHRLQRRYGFSSRLKVRKGSASTSLL